MLSVYRFSIHSKSGQVNESEVRIAMESINSRCIYDHELLSPTKLPSGDLDCYILASERMAKRFIEKISALLVNQDIYGIRLMDGYEDDIKKIFWETRIDEFLEKVKGGLELGGEEMSYAHWVRYKDGTFYLILDNGRSEFVADRERILYTLSRCMPKAYFVDVTK